MNVIQPDWPAPANIRALTTTKNVWGVNDSKIPAEREKLFSALNLPSQPVWLKQIHSAVAVPAEPQYLNHEADASYTATAKTVCLVLTADCLPLLICNRQGTHVAAIHAGWRGLASGVVENTIEALKQSPEDILVWLGPAITQKNYEVGADVYDAFVSRHPDASTGFTPTIPGKWMASLYQLARFRLAKMGINHVYGGKYCTFDQGDLFFSWRRDKVKHGGMASLIWME